MLGDDIPFTYTYQGVEYTGHFLYNGSETGSWCYGANIEYNTIAGSASVFNTYQVVRYLFESPISSGNVTLNDVDISINMQFSGGARGGFLVGGMGTASVGSPNTTFNLISNGRSYCATFDALSCNSQADSSLANYYNIVNTNYQDKNMRSILYDDVDFSINHVYYNNLRTSSFPSISTSKTYSMLYVMCPYTYGNFSASVVDTTTTTTGTTSANYADVVSGLDELNTGMNELNTGVSELNSGMDELNTGVSELHSDVLDIGSNVISALLVPDETLASMNFDPLDTLPDLNYNQVIDDADDVLEDIPSGIVGAASMWAMLDLLFGVDSAFIWIIPLAIFMCIACWVIWRK